MNRESSQSGLVSILTVIFFMIFISIIVLGFIKIMGDEQRQATDNDLSASALAAAQSGIEDAKRIILRCKDTPAPGGCDNPMGGMMNSGAGAGNCDMLGMANSLTGPLAIDIVGDEAIVGDDTYRQAYTCLTIKKDTDDVKKTLTEGRSAIIKLDVGAGGLDSLTFRWTGSGGTYGVNGPSTLFPARANWLSGTNTVPPMLRLQFIPYVAGSVALDTVERESRTAFVKPASVVASPSDIQVLDQRNATPGSLRTAAVSPVVYANCPVLGSTYECTKTLTNFSTARTYYLRATLMYGAQTNLTITATRAGVPQTFKFVQPEIDVTGRANDVYRRVKARVSFEAPSITYPEYALESGTTICKRLIVADATNSQYVACP
jgi:hypothetical protein